jgi:lipopolysaccharide/colanic/teichoic acid biosynthesis glycosyltransferase
VLLAPILLVVGLLVRATMGSPVLFRQRRSGLRGREFTIVKFRTMRAPDYPDQPDPERDTPLGRALRATSLDELPQLWNVLRGDMSLIGPRPTLPEQVVHYSERQRGRLAIRPRITGWAQVNGRNSISWPERIELDLWYIEHRSLAVDLRIVGRTLGRLAKPSGVTAEGGVNPGFPVPDRKA